ncbi:MAG: CAT RNA binding domain-containing protein [Terrisporobacter sp.]
MKLFMKITKVINNNVGCAFNENNKEVVIMGG